MKKVVLAALLAVSVSAPAFAQMGPREDPYGDATVAKADVVKAGMARFDQLDANHDGTISADELASASQGRGGRGLARADANGDGAITRDEFAASQGQRFDMMDGNKDGQLTKAERDDFRAQMMARMQARQGGGD
jgi:hypothetical protein